MIKVLRFLAMCTISVAFATIASAQVHTSIDSLVRLPPVQTAAR